MNQDKTTVLVFGTFDVIHPGHKWFLRKARLQGDRLVAAVARDTFIKEWKGHHPLLDEQSRILALEESGLVDTAILSDSDIRTYGVVDAVKPDFICLGHDQKALKDDIENWLTGGDQLRPEIVVLPPWKRDRFSSTRRNRTLKGAGEVAGTQPWGLYFLMVIAMVTFGFSWVSGKRIAGFASPAVLAAIRFTLTALCLLPVMLVKKPKEIKNTHVKICGWAWTAAAAMALSIYNLFFFNGLGAGLAGQGGLIVTSLNPLFTFLIVAALSRTFPRGGSFMGVLVGITGGVLLMQPWKYSVADLLDTGNISFLLAALSWSLLTVIGRKAQSILGFRRFNLGLYVLATLIVLPYAILSGGPESFSGIPIPGQGMPGGTRFWGDMFFISAATGAFGTGAYFLASSRLGAARGSAFTYLVPVFALVFTFLLLGEVPDPWMVGGSVLAIIAVTLINRRY